jgi:predicted protein tyrosine phosphatase
MNLLFICSRNQWRSPTAEAIFKNDPRHTARSAGTSKSARIVVNESMLRWADIVFVMEKRHRQILLERFETDKEIVVLNIPDEYQFMDAELVEMITTCVAQHLNS